MDIIHVVMGGLLLLFGRRLFWMFVGIAGFLAGAQYGGLVFAGHPQWVVLLSAFFVGLLGIVAALFLKRIAFGIGGFFAGAYVAMMVVTGRGVVAEPNVVLLVGGIIGALAAVLIMDWAIIFLSGLVGAGAAVLNVPLSQPTLTISYIALAAFGIIYQGIYLLNSRKQGLQK